MIKRNLWKAILSSLITLLPIAFGVIFWDALPDVIATHFGPDGTADGFSGKLFAVLFIPLLMLALNWLCIISIIIDSRKTGQSEKVYGMFFFICPLLSLLTSGIIYAVALGFTLNIGLFVCLIFGIMFVVLGNYMPKVTRNRTMGVKIKWTLQSDENWVATHRFAGRIYFFGGFAVILAALLPMNLQIAVVLPFIFLLALSPMVYSYVFYRRQKERGEITDDSRSNGFIKKSDKVAGIVSTVVIAAILIGVAVLMFTGNVTAHVGEDALTVDSTYYEKVILDYDKIDSAEYREDFDIGHRSYGFGSARLCLGVFQNKELGYYTCYSYVGAEAHLVIKSGDKFLVIGLETPAETKALYDSITAKIAP
ncbi:MAG: SdpI family protein [Clostridia bacterium]|nr:SdpI family protein [Clostridia bacterium]